ncbi:MAG: nucleotidyltransferase [Christensenellales bacterium]
MRKVLGIVAEYNPFHNGHFYHMQESKKITEAYSCICVISGNFTQRGEPSIVNKWAKTYMALCCGADLVIELPTIYSISSAENFASGAIKIFDSLKIVTDISFGAECNDLATLNNIANVFYSEPANYKTILNHELKRGLSYPMARENAVLMYLNDIKRYANVLSNSNNILAIEYLKALKQQKSMIQPNIVPRKNVYYNDQKIVDDFASATAIRKLMLNREYAEVRKVVPRSTYQIIGEEYKKNHIILGIKKYEKEIIYALRVMPIEEIQNLPDVNEGLEFAIKKAASETNDIEELIEKVKSKRYTQTRIQRILVYVLLGITKKDMEDSKKMVPYVRVLGFNSRGKILISEIMNQNPKLNMITSVGKYVNKKMPKNKQLTRMLDLDINATNIYTLGYGGESKANLDYTQNMIIIK